MNSFIVDTSWQQLLDDYVIPDKHVSKNLRFCSATCNICGERLDVITYVHAEKHGYSDPYKFIHKGNVKFDSEILNEVIRSNIDENKNI